MMIYVQNYFWIIKKLLKLKLLKNKLLQSKNITRFFKHEALRSKAFWMAVLILSICLTAH